MSRPPLCYVASYDPGYSRNVDVIQAFRRAGAKVEVIRGPVDRARGGGCPSLVDAALDQLARKLLLPLDVFFRMLRCRALVIGYFGQADMLLLAPIARLLGRPVIFNPLVSLTDTLIEDRRLLPDGGVSAALVRLFDRAAMQLSDVVLVDTPENREFVVERLGVDAGRTVVFPVGVDERIFYPRESGAAAGSGGNLDVLFYGKFIPLHGVETIVEAAALVEQQAPDIRFEMIGTGQRYDHARQLAARLGVQCIEWTDWLPYEALGERLRRADVALGVFSGGDKAARVIPNKVHQALACGVPVITRQSPAVDGLLSDGESALLVPPDDPEALAATILKLAAQPALRGEIGAWGRERWCALASEARLAEIAAAVLDRVARA